jgi:membrane protease YdiL (CAAX protease family)
MDTSANPAAKLLINKEGEWRAVWRVLAFCIVLFIILTVSFTLLAALAELIPQLRLILTAGSEDLTPGLRVAELCTSSLLSLASALAASAICARALERRSFASTGYMLHRGWLRDFTLGSLLGALVIAFAVGVALAFGAMKFQPNSLSLAQAVIYFLVLLATFLLAAAFEEVLVRGFAFQAILHNAGPVAAVTITSLVFSLLHARNENFALLPALNTALAGVWLGVAYLKTRSLWLATALHYSWNFAMVFFFGLPVSGFDDFTPLALLDGDGLSPAWLSGGNYGPEGGIITTIAMIASTFLLMKTRFFNPSEEMLASLSHGSLSARPAPGLPEDSRASD